MKSYDDQVYMIEAQGIEIGWHRLCVFLIFLLLLAYYFSQLHEGNFQPRYHWVNILGLLFKESRG
jgi:thiosulfate reductase cytochrome b subunit